MMTLNHHDLAREVGVEPAVALALMAVLQTHGLVTLKLAVHHEIRIGTRASQVHDWPSPGRQQQAAALLEYGRGFPASPWTCPVCLDEFSVSDLRFEIVAVREEQGRPR